jgi:hypothetical protein
MSKNKKITYVMNDLSNFLHMKANTYSRFAVMRFCNHAIDFSPNCTPLSSITIMYIYAVAAVSFLTYNSIYILNF